MNTPSSQTTEPTKEGLKIVRNSKTLDDVYVFINNILNNIRQNTTTEERKKLRKAYLNEYYKKMIDVLLNTKSEGLILLLNNHTNKLSSYGNYDFFLLDLLLLILNYKIHFILWKFNKISNNEEMIKDEETLRFNLFNNGSACYSQKFNIEKFKEYYEKYNYKFFFNRLDEINRLADKMIKNFNYYLDEDKPKGVSTLDNKHFDFYKSIIQKFEDIYYDM